MTKSMTGYGKGECVLSDHSKITVEIRSLNGKNAEINLKGNGVPKEKEIEVRKAIASKLVRGSIECTVNQSSEEASLNKKIDSQIVGSYFRQVREILEKECGTNIENQAINAAILTSVLKFPDVISSKSEAMSEEDWKKIEETLELATERLSEYRETEGVALYKDVTSRVRLIEEYLEEVKKEDVKRAPAVRERIKAKIEDAGLTADPSRLEQEMVFYVEKLDINEEKVRLGQHCKYFMQTIDSEPYPGKKLGFIVQEMGREINTIGSKANDADIQRLVVKMKDELEKIREQSMNIL
ncbi:MAG: YicC/YloC family endoribonuclease [Candidatus Egerieousia sp.]